MKKTWYTFLDYVTGVALCIALAIRAAFLCVVVLSAGGCAAKTTRGNISLGGPAIVRAQVRNEQTSAAVEKALPDTGAKGRVWLESATDSLIEQVKDLLEAQRAAIEKDKTINQQADRLVRLDTELASERDQWFGDKLHKLAALIVGIAVAAWITLGVSGIAFGAVGWMGTSKNIMRFLPLANIFAWLRDRAVRK